MDRYHRQILLRQIQKEGQNRLFDATVLLVGVGALGCTVADQLCRAGVGRLVLVDRDVVDATNLNRQILYTESDSSSPTPKVIAAENALKTINPACEVIPILEDLNPGNVLRLIEKYRPIVIIDSTDNVGTRFLLNDVAVKCKLPLVYGGCVGTEGRLATIIPGQTPCLRCLFPNPPAPSELPTCDTAGILGPVAAIIGAMQAAEAMKLIVSGQANIKSNLITIELWNNRFKSIDTTGQIDPACKCCVKNEFEFLNAPANNAISLCGRNTVQYMLEKNGDGQLLDRVAAKLEAAGRTVFRSDYLVQFQVDETHTMEVFNDGRVLLHGCNDPRQARTIISQWLG